MIRLPNFGRYSNPAKDIKKAYCTNRYDQGRDSENQFMIFRFFGSSKTGGTFTIAEMAAIKIKEAKLIAPPNKNRVPFFATKSFAEPKRTNPPARPNITSGKSIVAVIHPSSLIPNRA